MIYISFLKILQNKISHKLLIINKLYYFTLSNINQMLTKCKFNIINILKFVLEIKKKL